MLNRGCSKQIRRTGNGPAGGEFGALLKRLRCKAGLSQAALASAAGLSQQAISKLEVSAGKPTWTTACALASALGADLADFRPHESLVPKACPPN
jgi:DNA-binding XRE family transcriptional regulator